MGIRYTEYGKAGALTCFVKKDNLMDIPKDEMLHSRLIYRNI